MLGIVKIFAGCVEVGEVAIVDPDDADCRSGEETKFAETASTPKQADKSKVVAIFDVAMKA